MRDKARRWALFIVMRVPDLERGAWVLAGVEPAMTQSGNAR
jgi:hypothetical protein